MENLKEPKLLIFGSKGLRPATLMSGSNHMRTSFDLDDNVQFTPEDVALLEAMVEQPNHTGSAYLGPVEVKHTINRHEILKSTLADEAYKRMGLLYELVSQGRTVAKLHGCPLFGLVLSRAPALRKLDLTEKTPAYSSARSRPEHFYILAKESSSTEPKEETFVLHPTVNLYLHKNFKLQ